METTLSGRAKDYSFVTDGEREGTHTFTKGKKKDMHTLAHIAQR